MGVIVRVYRILVLALAALGAVIMAPTAASAQNYVPPAVSAPPRAELGSTIPFNGTNFLPNSPISIDVSYSSSNAPAGLRENKQSHVVLAGLPAPKAFLRTVVADANGSFSTPVTLTQVGVATLTATGLDRSGDPVSLSATVVVFAEEEGPQPTSTRLPVTGMSGGSLATQVATGVGAIIAGVVMVWFTMLWRRRSAGRL
jgi:hypothetical protein